LNWEISLQQTRASSVGEAGMDRQTALRHRRPQVAPAQRFSALLQEQANFEKVPSELYFLWLQ
jgi:hypothetical protein